MPQILLFWSCCIVIGYIAFASLTSFCSLTFPLISRASKETRGKFISFVLDLAATASSLTTQPNLLNLLFAFSLISSPHRMA
jgi:hypothetical protein